MGKSSVMDSRLSVLALLQLGTAILFGGPWLYHRYRPATRWSRTLTNAGQEPVFALVCLVLAALMLLAAFLK